MPRHNQGPYLADDRNASGFYEIRWTENGRSKRKSTGQADRRAAQRVYAEFLLALDSADEVTAGAAISIGRCIDAYLADHADAMAAETQASRFATVRAYFGDMAVGDLEQDDVARYQTARAEGFCWTDAEGRERGGRKVGASTVRQDLAGLMTALRYCAKKKKFKAPNGEPLLKLAHIPDLDLPAEAPPKDLWLTRAQAQTFLRACAEPQPGSGEDDTRLTRAYRCMAMALYTASRLEPIVALTWDRIRLQEDPVRLAAGDYGMIDFQVPGRRRTRKRRGWVPIAAELHPILVQAKREAIGPNYLDRQTKGYSALNSAAKRAGMPWITPHVLRHTFATWAAQDGVSLFQIAGILHDTVATVEKRYAHHCPDHLRSAVNRAMLRAA